MTTQVKPPAYSLSLKRRALVAERTLELRLGRPAAMSFRPGQSVDFSLIAPPETDPKGDTRPFSINAAPDEAELIFTTRLRDSAFKRVLATMPLGTRVQVAGPFGDFTLPNRASRPIVLLAGGIGITPFRSMARWATRQHLPHRILLFYANRRPEDAPFLDELAELAAANPNLTVVPVMTQANRSSKPWPGETGHIDRALLEKYVGRLPAEAGERQPPLYYLAGPPGMVTGLRRLLVDAGVDDDDLRTEEFSGY